MVLARFVKLTLALLTAFAGLWIGAYAGLWTAAVFEELYRPFAEGLSDLHSRTLKVLYVMSVGLAALFALLGYKLHRQVSHAAAFIGVGIGLYVGIRIGDYVGDWYWRYATSETNQFFVAYLGTSLVWAVLLALGGYLLGRWFERRFQAAKR